MRYSAADERRSEDSDDVLPGFFLLIRVESPDFAALGAFYEPGVEVGHERKFGPGVVFPAEVERGHEVAEMFAVEDHAVENVVHEGLNQSMMLQLLVCVVRVGAALVDTQEGVFAPVLDVVAVFVIEILKLANDAIFDTVLAKERATGIGRLAILDLWPGHRCWEINAVGFWRLFHGFDGVDEFLDGVFSVAEEHVGFFVEEEWVLDA